VDIELLSIMLKGTLEIWLGELECHLLRAGDSLWFESHVGHRWFNSSDADLDQHTADVSRA
jgi:quercetin dioxygenase-like cupin family protein